MHSRSVATLTAVFSALYTFDGITGPIVDPFKLVVSTEDMIQSRSGTSISLSGASFHVIGENSSGLYFLANTQSYQGLLRFDGQTSKVITDSTVTYGYLSPSKYPTFNWSIDGSSIYLTNASDYAGYAQQGKIFKIDSSGQSSFVSSIGPTSAPLYVNDGTISFGATSFSPSDPYSHQVIYSGSVAPTNTISPILVNIPQKETGISSKSFSMIGQTLSDSGVKLSVIERSTTDNLLSIKQYSRTGVELGTLFQEDVSYGFDIRYNSDTIRTYTAQAREIENTSNFKVDSRYTIIDTLSGSQRSIEFTVFHELNPEIGNAGIERQAELQSMSPGASGSYFFNQMDTEIKISDGLSPLQPFISTSTPGLSTHLGTIDRFKDVYLTDDTVAVTGRIGSSDALFVAGIKEEAPPKKHLVIVTHGFQPQLLPDAQTPGLFAFGNSEAPDSRLPALSSALKSKLGDGIQAGNVQVLEFHWPEAYGIFYNYNDVKGTTDEAGQHLAIAIQEYLLANGFNSENLPTFHFIGHSLGTLVNAEAVKHLNSPQYVRRFGSGIAVDQFTILDSPLNPLDRDAVVSSPSSLPQQGFPVEHEEYFASMLKAGTVKYVENYFGGDTQSIFRAWGQPIAGTGPCETALGRQVCRGQFFPNANHSEVVDEYAKIILGDWQSPAAGTFNPQIEWNDSDVLAATRLRLGRKDTQRDIGLFETTIVTVESVFVEGEVIILPDGGRKLITNSPAKFGVNIVLPENLSYILFDADFGSAAARLRLFLDDLLLFEVSNFDGSLKLDDIYVDLADLAGLDGILFWQLDPLTDLQAQLTIRDIRLGLSYSSVSEPVTFSLLSLGLLLLFLRQWRLSLVGFDAKINHSSIAAERRPS